MVRLDRITMQGFKSFANKTTVPFPRGFNVVCGPNGSGKSNIVDGLMFVLGTSSARSIRALKLQNLTFNGSKSRGPADSCDVSLYLDNSDNKIPGGEQEIKVTRKISRSGISIYKLNGKTVTRSKILDLLANANLSPEGYNIILQGDVTKIIEMSPLERRGVINDVSGISEFDEKKEKAQRELERVEIWVRENMIVVAEKQRLVSRLKEEKENAERFVELDKNLKKAKASLLHKRMKEAETRMKVLDKNIDEGTSKFEQLDKELVEKERLSEKIGSEIKTKDDELIKKTRDYEIVREIDKIKTEVVRKKDRIDSNIRDIQRLNAIISSSVMSGAVKSVLDLRKEDIHGTVSSLVTIPKKYLTALEVAIGRHKDDIVVSSEGIAADYIKYLKEKKIGRARFLPLDTIKSRKKKSCDKGFIGYAIELIKFDKKYYPAVSYVLGSTLVVDDIDAARKIKGFRVVTLDGDMIEPSGAMIGGFYKITEKSFGGGYLDEIDNIKKENEAMEKEIKELEAKLKEMEVKERDEADDIKELQETKTKYDDELRAIQKRRNDIYEEKIILQSSIGKLKIEKAKIEANIDNLKVEVGEYTEITQFFDLAISELEERVRRYVAEINKLGPINMKALEEYKTINVEFEELRKKLDKLLEEKDAVLKIVNEIEKKRYDKFMQTLSEIKEHFSKIYIDMAGGVGTLRMEEENNIDTGLIIEASPEGKKVLNLDSMSGGEKTLTSLAFLFGVMHYYSAPFYVLDEVDAALDKANTRKIADLVKKYSDRVQIIVITHNDLMIQEADKVFGVSMEDGVSKVFGIEMPKG